MTASILMGGGFAAFYLIGFCYSTESWIKSAIKTVSVLLLALSAFWFGTPGLLVIALLFCTAGDYLLSRPGEQAFMAGVGAFAAGHLAYILLFLGYAQADLAQPVPITALILLGLVMMRVLYRPAGALRFAVMAYVPVILGMGITAMLVPADGSFWLILPSALLFIASDTILSVEVFLLRPGHPARRFTPYAIWLLYWLAQLGFLMAFMPGQSLA